MGLSGLEVSKITTLPVTHRGNLLITRSPVHGRPSSCILKTYAHGHNTSTGTVSALHELQDLEESRTRLE